MASNSGSLSLQSYCLAADDGVLICRIAAALVARGYRKGRAVPVSSTQCRSGGEVMDGWCKSRSGLCTVRRSPTTAK
jgi:hypothetical protein